MLARMKAVHAAKELAEAEAARLASPTHLSALIDTSIAQIEALLQWDKACRTGQPSNITTAFHDYHELREQQKIRLDEYERRARVLKMKLELAKIAVNALGKEVAGIRACVEECEEVNSDGMEE